MEAWYTIANQTGANFRILFETKKPMIRQIFFRRNPK